jgi:cysteine desulfurase
MKLLIFFVAIKMSYFDCNANMPMSQDVFTAYKNGCEIGNVSVKTQFSNLGNKIIERLKENVNDIHGGNYITTITSGGSESNSSVIFHFLYRSILANKRLKIVSSMVEHPSITEYLLQLQNDGIADITWIKPEYNGKIKIKNIIAATSQDVDCVFLQSVNSETGCIQDISQLYNYLHAKNIWLHVDNVQGFKKMTYPANIGDSISISFHKIGAPLGIGALLTKEKLHPMIAGKQNNGMRGGTYNIGAITASMHMLRKYKYSITDSAKNRFLEILARKYNVILYPEFMRLYEGKNITIPDSIILFSNDECLPHTIFFSIVKSGNVLCGLYIKDYLFESKKITVGNGSACNNEKASIIGSMSASDIPPKIKKGFLRVSFDCEKCNLEKLASAINSLHL